MVQHCTDFCLQKQVVFFLFVFYFPFFVKNSLLDLFPAQEGALS